MGQTAEELLDSLSEEEISAYTADSATEEHIVVGADRFITVPDSLKRIAVQFDHNIETVTFDCPRYWDGHDMSTMRIYINYMRPDNVKGMFLATNVAVDSIDTTMMHFDWTISREVTAVKGTVSFLVCVTKIDGDGNEDKHWNSELNKQLTISEGLECQASILEPYPDIVTDLLTRMDLLEGAVNGELLDDIMAEINTIKAGDASRDNTISALEQRVVNDEADISELQTDVGNAEADITNLGIRVLTNEKSIDDLEAEMESLRNSGIVSDLAFGELEQRVATNETDIANLKTAVTKIDESLTAIITTETF